MPVVLTNVSSWLLLLVMRRILIKSEELFTLASPAVPAS